MVSPTTAGMLGVAVVASGFMAWSIGAGSSGSTPFAPAVGANAISVMRAGFVVGILGLLGATLQGANVTETVGRELVRGVTLSPAAAVIGLGTAAGLVAIGVFRGYPIATAFTVTGAVVGAGLAMGGAPAWGTYAEIATLWLLIPFVGGSVAYATARLLRSDQVEETTAVPLLAGVVGLILANVEFVLLGPPGEGTSIASATAGPIVIPIADATRGISPLLPILSLRTVVAALVSLAVAVAVSVAMWRELHRDRATGQRRFLLALGALVAFSAGGSQVGLALGPLLPILDNSPVSVPLTVLLLGGGVGLLAGSWTGAPRMIKALSQDYSSLGPRRSIAALIPAFAIAQTAVFFGIPVSFNEIVVSAILGSGYAAGGGDTSGRKMAYTVLAWIGSLLGAGVVSYGAFVAVTAVV